MLKNITLHPPASREIRAELKDRKPTFLDKAFRFIMSYLEVPLIKGALNMRGFVAMVDKYSEEFASLEDDALKVSSINMSLRLHEEGLTDKMIARSFALVREVSHRVLGMRHYDCQLMGGFAIIRGTIAEMATGEGKTLAATLPAATAAMAGIPVHVVTVNDYLTERDAKLMEPVYKALGLNVGYAIHDMDPQEKQKAYDCKITYCTNKELTFDYLKDLIVLGTKMDPLRLQAENLYTKVARSRKIMMRGLHFAIVDEADSLLIDEARTPLIISGTTGGEDEKSFLERALQLARIMEEGKDFSIDEETRRIVLTDVGEEWITDMTTSYGPLWSSSVRRNNIIRQGLTALYLFEADVDYLVRDDKVQIIDEYTGRVMADRTWEHGLHQLIELKEGCEVTGRRETLSKISYQRFFRRYIHLSGMTGTAREVRNELLSVYDQKTIKIPTNRPVKRKYYRDRIFVSKDEKWQAVVERIEMFHKKGRPVLVGTRSVAASEHLSELLEKAGFPHQVLNAKNDREEADIVAGAGESGRITVATNMAGRGTDIKPDTESLERGGLHVILTERHDAARIDRQLAGRSARQGDPGSFEAILSLEDNILEGKYGISKAILKRIASPESLVWSFAARLVILRAQKRVEKTHAKIRNQLFKEDLKRQDMLTFAGRFE